MNIYSRLCDNRYSVVLTQAKAMTIEATRQTIQKFPGLICQGHYFDVPLDYENVNGTRITVFAREITSSENVSKEDLPWLVFLQGGPGFQSPRPESSSGWIKKALTDHRVLLLDQRGTGLSTPVTHETLTLFPDARTQFEYLKHFRADNIVRDCELIRKSLTGGKQWMVLGQSYGGFCITTYLSLAPEGLSGAILTGGLPPLVKNPDDVYRATYKQVIAKNKLFYDRFPEDVEEVRKIVDYLCANRVELTTGEVLTARRFLQLGINFGFKLAGNSMNTIHYLLERAFVPSSSGKRLSYVFLRGVENMLDYNTNPIYSLLHEAIYCEKQASNWSAERMLKEFPEFDLKHRPIFFTGEMIYSWMFDEYACLKPLKDAAQRLAEYTDWPALYDVEALKNNTVPCVASIYYDDMYVDRRFAEETASTIRGIKFWITNEYEHDGLRQDGEKILERLLSMLDSDN